MPVEDIEIKNHQESLDKKKTEFIGWVSFLMGFTQSLVIYVLSGYFKEILGTDNVGIFYALSYAVALFILLNLHKIVRIFGKSTAFYFSILFKIVVVAFLMLAPAGLWTVFLLMLYLISGAIEWASLDVILESFSTDNMSGRIRGKHLTLINAGFLIGPFLSNWILKNYGFEGIFLVLFVLNSIILTVSLLGIRKVNHEFTGKISVREIFEKVKIRKNVLRIHYISMVLEAFFALMVIYTPIYLAELGMGLEKVGLILSFMLIPFVIFQYPIGFIADKKMGEKELIILSLFLMTSTTLFVFYINSTSVVVWALALFATRIGAAILEILRDSYFYKRIDARDVDLIHFFRTSLPIGYILATLSSSILLIFLPVKFIFVFVAIAVFSALLPAIFLVDNQCEKEIQTENV